MFWGIKSVHVLTCAGRDCGGLADPTNGAVDLTNGTIFTSVAIYSCLTGFFVNGTTSRVCQSDGSWSNTPPSCEGKDREVLRHNLSNTDLIGRANLYEMMLTQSMTEN